MCENQKKNLKTMKTILLSALMSLIMTYVSGQDKQDTLRIIDHKVEAIDQYKDYWTSTFKDEAFLDTGFIKQANKGYGLLTGYFKNGKICKIRELIGLKLLQDIAVTEYYFSEGKLIFVNEQEHAGPAIFVDADGTVEHRIDEPTFEVRYYFNNDKLIGSAEKGNRQTILLPNKEFFDSQSKEGQLLSSAKKYYERFSIKYKN